MENDLKKIYWILVAAAIVITIATGYNQYQSRKTLDEAIILRDNLKNQSEECYFKVGNDQCVTIDEIGIISKESLDQVCSQSNCTNATGRRRAIAMLIVYNNLTEKKLILIDKDAIEAEYTYNFTVGVKNAGN